MTAQKTTMRPEGRTELHTSIIISNFASLANIEPEKFWALIKEQNKVKRWSVAPVKIEFRDGQIIENSKEVGKLINLLDDWIEKELNESDLNKLKQDEEITRTIYEWFSGSRKQLTKPLDNLKKNFTSLEKRIKEDIDRLKQKQLELQEEEFKRREKVLRDYLKDKLDEIYKEHQIRIDEKIFEDFIRVQRKNKILTEKGNLTSSVKKKADEKIEEVLKPVLEEREKRKLKEQDLKKLAFDLENINTNALFVDELKEAVSRLKKFRDMATNLYPNATDEALAQIQAKIEIAEVNIQKLEVEDRRNKDKEADEKLLKEVQEIANPAAKETVESLEAKLAKLRELRSRAKLAETIHKIDETGIEIKEDLLRLKAIKLEVKQESEIVETLKTNRYKIPLDEIEVICSMEIEAESEEKAKAKAVDLFRKQIEFIELERV